MIFYSGALLYARRCQMNIYLCAAEQFLWCSWPLLRRVVVSAACRPAEQQFSWCDCRVGRGLRISGKLNGMSDFF